MAMTQRQMTIEEFLNLPERKPALEFEDGVITQKVSPQSHHSVLQFALAERFNRFGRSMKLALAFPELRWTFGTRSYVPDVAVYRWERIPRTPDGELVNGTYDAPDIAIEILSPGQSVKGLVRKCRWYVGNGVRVALLVDPDDRSVRSFRPGAGQPVELRGPDRIELDEVLPGFELTVDKLFSALRLD